MQRIALVVSLLFAISQGQLYCTTGIADYSAANQSNSYPCIYQGVTPLEVFWKIWTKVPPRTNVQYRLDIFATNTSMAAPIHTYPFGFENESPENVTAWTWGVVSPCSIDALSSLNVLFLSRMTTTEVTGDPVTITTDSTLVPVLKLESPTDSVSLWTEKRERNLILDISSDKNQANKVTLRISHRSGVSKIKLAGGSNCPEDVDDGVKTIEVTSDDFTVEFDNMAAGKWWLKIDESNSNSEVTISMQVNPSYRTNNCNSETGWCTPEPTNSPSGARSEKVNHEDFVIAFAVIGGLVVLALILVVVVVLAKRLKKEDDLEATRLLG